jgi:quercetin dioxygenase-like cupin family protein
MTTATATRIDSTVSKVMQDLVRVHLGHEDTDGGVFVMEVTVPPGGGPPPIHTHVPAELFFTLEGQLTYFRDDGGDELTVITGGPGTTAFMPGGVGHTYRNFSDGPARYLAVVTPGQAMQEFLAEAAVAVDDEPRTPEEVIALSLPYGFAWTDRVPGPTG